ncbi:MFS transporter [Congregibacter sp.]|uniref:MFS transporter n=1 Tax=Congregibacter sp. TaxID=2744308 RepID=UPI00385EA62A
MAFSSLPRVVWLYTLIQSLAVSVGSMMVIVGGVLGAALAPEPAYATLPVAVMISGTAVSVLPITRLMRRFGRKPIFLAVTIVAVFASLLAAQAASDLSFALFCCAALGFGCALAGIQQLRFAAMEAVSIDLMPKAASTVLLGGLAAAIIGPELATRGRDLIGAEFVGTFLLMAGICGACTFLFLFTPSSKAQANEVSGDVRSLREMIRNPTLVMAIVAAVGGYGLMSFIMTATPVHMHVYEGHSLDQTKLVIQSHVLAMFLPSFFSGWLISRWGAAWVIRLGLLAYAMTVTLALTGSAILNYWTALVLLGVGWNFLFLAGTTLLPLTYAPAERFKAQGLNEMLVFGFQATAALSAGAVLHWLGWKNLLLACIPLILLLAFTLIWWQKTQRAPAPVSN